MRQLKQLTSLDLREKDLPDYEIQYYLTNDAYQYPDVVSRDGYGIEIRLCLHEKLIDRICVDDITTSKENAEKLIRVLSLHEVTPITLKDILEDMLGTGNGPLA